MINSWTLLYNDPFVQKKYENDTEKIRKLSFWLISFLLIVITLYFVV